MSTPLRVLFVEDSEDDAILVLRELRRSGYEPTSTRVDSPEDMATALDEQEWDIVLSDYSMPRFSMATALAMVKEKDLGLPFIIVSGAISAEAAVAAMRDGAHDYVMKNDLARLVPAVERELRETEMRRERQQVQQALRDSEELSSALIGNLTDAVFLFRGDAIAWCNDRVEEIYGYPKDELLSKKASFFYPTKTDSSELTRGISTAMEQQGVFRGTSKFRRKDGSFIDIEYSLSRIPNKDPIELIAVARDITERKRAEEQLRHSEEHYRALIENAQDFIAVVKADGTIHYQSPLTEELLGHESAYRGASTAFELVHPDDVEKASDVFTKLMSKPGSTARAEVRAKHKDESWHTFEVVGRNLLDDPAVGGIVANFRDITERKQAEEALQESESHYRLLAENITDIIATLNLNLQLTYMSPSVTHKLGFTVDEAISRTLEEALTPASQEYVVKTFTDEMAAEGTGLMDPTRSLTVELELNCKDGSTMWSEVEATFLRDHEGQPVGILAVARDISERKRAEEERNRLEQQLQLAGRLAAVGELAAGVAHELNNPLAAVQAFAQLLNDNDDLDKTVKGDIETIYREAQRATRITTNLLRFARRHKPEKQFISVNDIIEKSLELHEYRMKSNNIDLVLELDPDIPMTMADSDQIHQVFVNIITNAEQAMTDAHGKGNFLVKTQRTNQMIRTTFTDDGPGIQNTNLRNIFDPFFTTKEVGKGTGLGLSICFGIVQEHGGQIYAKNNPDKGATFVVEIPVISLDQPLSEQTKSIETQGAYDSPGRRN
ncbi:PAS domain S-box protein [Chloroflexota bacterium]